MSLGKRKEQGKQYKRTGRALANTYTIVLKVIFMQSQIRLSSVEQVGTKHRDHRLQKATSPQEFNLIKDMCNNKT
jgi:hypothetical protein